jgi:hypothetical protein
MRVDSCNDLYDECDTSVLPAPIFRAKPTWMNGPEFAQVCRPTIRHLIGEVYENLQHNCVSSAAMCLRAVIESVMIEKVGDNGTFADNLARFVSDGYIGSKQGVIISSALEVGHAVIHRNYRPKKEQLVAVLDIVEAMLASVYLHPALGPTISKGVPPKPPRVKKADPVPKTSLPVTGKDV